MKSELTDEFIGNVLNLWIVFLDCDASYSTDSGYYLSLISITQFPQTTRN
jgi:hypothetical protein